MPFTNTTPSESLYVTQIRFCRALAVVRSLPTKTNAAFQPSLSDKMHLYGLYKQAIAGDCSLKRPNARETLLYAKWRAWDSMKGKNPIEAQVTYIHALVELLEEVFIRRETSTLGDLNESLNYLIEVEDDSYEAEIWDASDQYYTQQEQFPSSQSTPTTLDFPLTPQASEYIHKHHKDDYAHTLYEDLFDQQRSYNTPISMLQSEVTALCREMRSLQFISSKSIFQWHWLWFLKSVAKHAIFNCLSSILLFFVLWRRKSPIAYAVISYVGPRVRDVLQYLTSRIIA
ncbi:hypothetical protein MUCCIDRAFT_108156 [Mucor lusitanicus CBS 277.49]|uniref:ACB domain-containing protein n=1 Tax=Mucor lusitanicus CBS 277.49 TaxID=747725 RepID=A0A168M3I4_MUCCL|nr:hypothetical protein MUCCIDRAFT_108156 [Mucor lusitanicus CBS 277.49]